MNAEPPRGSPGTAQEMEDGKDTLSRERLEAQTYAGELSLGAVVDRYEIRGELGRGGTGVVYLAHQPDLDRLVGLKALHRIHADAADFAERFARESRVTGSLSHPNIVTVYEYFVEHQTPFIAMEYVPGGSLRPWVGQLSLAQVVGVLEGLLSALAAVRPAGIVHRDLKPENLLVTADGRVKIADFGIATASEERIGSDGRRDRTDGDKASRGATVGTPEYMAPEQALSHDIDGRADLYSVGIIAFEQLTGEVPFGGVTDPIALLLRHINDPIPSLAESRPDIDRSLCDWVAGLVARDPNDRPAAAQQAWDELEELAINLLGPVWRRDARLLGPMRIGTDSAPEPGRFQSRHLPVPVIPRSSSRDPISPDDVPAGHHPERRRLFDVRRSVLLPAASVAAILMGGLAGGLASLLLGAGQQSALGEEPLSAITSTPSFQIRLPTTWSAQRSIPSAFADFEPTSAVSLSSATKKAQLNVGITRTTSATLLPPTLLAHVSPPPHRERVQLESGYYYRYRSLELKGLGVRANVYAQPTTGGVLLAMCVFPGTSAGSGFASATAVGVECERMIGAMRVLSARTLSLGPRQAYARALAAALVYVDAAQRSTGRQLRRAASAAAQASAAKHLASAYAVADSMLAKVQAGPAEAEATLALKQALARASGGYATMAAAAAAADVSAFDHARSAVTMAQAAMVSSVGRLRGLGYRISD